MNNIAKADIMSSVRSVWWLAPVGRLQPRGSTRGQHATGRSSQEARCSHEAEGPARPRKEVALPTDPWFMKCLESSVMLSHWVSCQLGPYQSPSHPLWRFSSPRQFTWPAQNFFSRRGKSTLQPLAKFEITFKTT